MENSEGSEKVAVKVPSLGDRLIDAKEEVSRINEEIFLKGHGITKEQSENVFNKLLDKEFPVISMLNSNPYGSHRFPSGERTNVRELAKITLTNENELESLSSRIGNVRVEMSEMLKPKISKKIALGAAGGAFVGYLVAHGLVMLLNYIF